MKRFFYFAVICCMVMLTFSACEKDKEIGTTANLFGHWEAMVYSSEDMVFLSEVAEEGWYWGYEWNADDKPESDLLPGGMDYHGNGWFRWRKSNDTLYEYSTMDFRDVPIAHIYLVSAYDSMNIAVRETNGRSQYSFIKE